AWPLTLRTSFRIRRGMVAMLNSSFPAKNPIVIRLSLGENAGLPRSSLRSRLHGGVVAAGEGW
ncbi:MAG: hypothetical protein ABGY41_22285, partial [Candidatus Poribacteria bacterium]